MCELPRRNASKTQIGIWKLLATACDQARASKRALKQVMKPTSRLSESLENGRASDAYDVLPAFDLFDCGDRLLHVLDASDWNHVVDLLGAYRRVRKFADEHGLNLWKA